MPEKQADGQHGCDASKLHNHSRVVNQQSNVPHCDSEAILAGDAGAVACCICAHRVKPRIY